MKSGIYAIWNSQADKIYIGQAVDLYRRWRYHKLELKNDRHGNPYLQSAYNKNGKLYMVFYVIEYCSNSQSILDEREQYYMDLHNSYDREYGYNLSPTAGGSCTGYKHSEETKALLSSKRKNKPRTEEAKAAIKAGWEKRKAKGPVSEETKRKLSESHKGNKPDISTLLKMSVKKIGNKHSVGAKRTPEHLAALAEGRRKAARMRFKALMFID